MPAIYSPSDGTLIAERQLATDIEISDALANAYDGQKHWQQTTLRERAAICQKAIDWFGDNQQVLAEEISQFMGRPIQYANGEIAGVKERAEYMIEIAEGALQDSIIKPESADSSVYKRLIRRIPLGTAFIIAPWNYPYLTAVNSIIPALMAGNSVILKHASQTLLCAEQFDKAFKAAGLPAGVFQYLHLNHAQTLAAIQSDDIHFVSFTGSVSAGKIIEQTLAGSFKPLALELGGKDPAYVRADADVATSIECLVDGAFFNSGQSCCGIERIYVAEEIFSNFVEGFVKQTKKLMLGHALDPTTSLGPMINQHAVVHAEQQLKDALATGAIAHIDAQDFPLDKTLMQQGNYLMPQVLTHVKQDMEIMQEESFAPIIGIMPVSSDADAMRHINDSAFGLTASIWTQDEDSFMKLSADIEAGTVFMNRCDYLDPSLPWSGIKGSGRGCSLSHLAYQQLTRPQSIHIKRLP
jgi:acyl-CoA reductase-like NAD-dependent aldehyde dehydrogenase